MGSKKKKNPPKDPDVLRKIKQAIQSGDYKEVNHVQLRQRQRDITRPEYEYVLLNGYHEKRKDEFSQKHQAWNYAVRGKTLDDREIRVAVSFKGNMLIITVIDLEP